MPNKICGGDGNEMPTTPQDGDLSFSWYCLAPVASVAGAILDCCDICGLTEEETNLAAARGADAIVRCIIVVIVVVSRVIVDVYGN
jgi:hypothetical protein